MKVILNQDVAKLGKKDQVVKVADGYALNYLLPKGLAFQATANAIAEIETKNQKEQELRTQKEAQMKAEIEKLKPEELAISAKANEKGNLFAAISVDDIAELLSKLTGLDFKAAQIEPVQPIKEIGEHAVKLYIGDQEIRLKLQVTK